MTSTGSKNLSFGAYSDTKFNSFDADKWIKKIQAFKINQEIPKSNGKIFFLCLSFKTTWVVNLPVESSSVKKEEESKYINNW